VQPLVFDAGTFMEQSGRPGIELLLEMGGKGGVKSAGNDVRAGSCPHRRQNAGRAERNCAWVFGIRGELAAEIRALPQSRLLVPQNDEVMTNVLLGPFTRLGRAALKRGALPTEVQARRLAEGGALENGIDLPAPASPGRVNIPLPCRWDAHPRADAPLLKSASSATRAYIGGQIRASRRPTTAIEEGPCPRGQIWAIMLDLTN
jgi:hypothetical protein